MKYFLGLDIGTSSVGWAVTNESYELQRAKGQDLWGVSLFPEASVAQDRRVKRGARRRWQRKKLMVQWLQEIFAKEIAKVDENFFIRLKESSLHQEDKNICLNNGKDSLFQTGVNGEKFTDKEYYKKYPTIFHLRKDLLEKPAEDIRFLYLALHNIIKSRGHFLNGDVEGESVKLGESFVRIITLLEELEIENKFSQNVVVKEETENALLEKMDKEYSPAKPFTLKRRVEHWCKVLEVEGDKIAKILVSACIYGRINKTDVKKLFGVETAVEIDLFDEEKLSAAILENLLAGPQEDLVRELSKVNASVVLNNLLGNNEYVCEAMVEIFNKHKIQLEEFKKFIKKYHQSKYFDMFRNQHFSIANKSNYCLYANTLLIGDKKQVLGLKKDGKKADFDRTIDGFYAYVKSVLNEKPESEELGVEYESAKEQILSAIDNKDFLLKQRTVNNSTIPNSFYVKELKKILTVNQAKFAFLNEVDRDGLSNVDKIVKIAKFRIPYYVGPIGNKGDNRWATRISDQPLKAWNLDKVVDLEAAEEQFIRRMTNSCTYLPGKDALPKNSIIYSKYKSFNELNNLTINGKRLNVAIKQKLFNELYLNASPKAKITKKKIEGFLRNNQIVLPDQDIVLGGIADEIQSGMQSYLQIENIVGEEYAANIDLCEDVVRWHTILQEKENVKNRLAKKYPFLTEQMLKPLKGLVFVGWATLSKEFLQDMKIVDKTTGEITNILDVLWNTQLNLQEILFSDKYAIIDSEFEVGDCQTIKQGLDKMKSGLGSVTYEDVSELYCSPAVKRSIWQTVKIINELKDLLGEYPEKVFVEVTRGEDQQNNKNVRYKQVEEKYNAILKDKKLMAEFAELQHFVNELNGYKSDALALRSDKLFLYFMQMGKCAYCGKPLSLSEVLGGRGCDIDHIIPQSMKKDDSLDNKVLVDRYCNQEVKKDVYPIYNLGFEKKCGHMWKKWLDAGLISSEKYDRLTRKEDLSAEDRAGFVSRQLVETSQSSKAVIDLLIRLLGDDKKVVFSKAGLVSEFRHRFSEQHGYFADGKWNVREGFSSLEKCRILNDMHHAKDAYLNIVVADVSRQRFTDNPINFFRNRESLEDKNTTNPIKIFSGKVRNYYNQKIVWDCEKDVARVAATCAKNSCMINSVSYYKTNGQFYDETLYKSKKNQPKTKAEFKQKGNLNNPLSNVEKYGGYNSLKNGYYMLVEAEDKKGKYRVIEAIPNIVIYQNIKNKNEGAILEYLESVGLKNPKIILDRINIRSTIKLNGAYFVITAKTGNQFTLENGNQFFTTTENAHYIKIIDKYMQLTKKKFKFDETNERIVVSAAAKEGNTELILTKAQNLILYDVIIEKLKNKVYVEFKSVLKKLEASRDRFINLSVAEQTTVLYNLVNKMGTTVAPVNLELIQPKGFKEEELDGEEGEEKGYKNTGKIYLNKKVSGKDIKLVIKSSLGFVVKEIDLNKYGV